MPERSLSNTHIFSIRHITALHLRTQCSTSTQYLDISEITNRKHKKCGTKQKARDIAYITRAKVRRHCSTSDVNLHLQPLKFFTARACPQMTLNAQRGLIFRLQIDFSNWTNNSVNTKPMNNDDKLYFTRIRSHIMKSLGSIETGKHGKIQRNTDYKIISMSNLGDKKSQNKHN